MRIVGIVNPIAGRGRVQTLLSDVCTSLRAKGAKVDLTPTRAAGDAIRILRDLGDDVDAVLAVGGDGTVREVVEGLFGRPTPIVVIPGGTENLVAGALGMTQSVQLIVETVLKGRQRSWDVGLANGRPFLIVTGIGFDAEVVARLAASRRGRISHLDYVKPVLGAMISYGFDPIRMEIDGETIFDGRGVAFVGVTPHYGGGFRVLRDAIEDDGLLDACVLPCANVGELAMHAFRIKVGRHIEHRGVIYRRCKRLRVSSPSHVPVETDGDPAGTLPVEVSLATEQAVFLAPKSVRPVDPAVPAHRATG